MLNIEALHEQAVDKAEDAFAMKRRGQDQEARDMFLEALELEKQAASSYPTTLESEPSRSILFRSAAALAFHAGDYEQAEYLVANGFSGFPPAEIKDELRLLQDEINFRRHISLQGTELADNQMQMTLWGDATGHGIISADLLVRRIEQIKALVYRTVERLTNLPYRALGKPPKIVTDHYSLFLNALIPASFGVTFSIGQPSEQLMLPGFELEQVKPDQVIDEVITCFELIQQNEAESLQERFSDDNYYQNFVAIAKQMAPDGEEIKVLGLATTMHDGSERSVGLRKTKREILKDYTRESENRREREVIRVEGQLKVADSLVTKNETGRVKLVESNGATITVRVPISQMQDIVQPYFDEYVVITGYRQGKSLYLTDIESGDANTAKSSTRVENLTPSHPTLFDET